MASGLKKVLKTSLGKKLPTKWVTPRKNKNKNYGIQNEKRSKVWAKNSVQNERLQSRKTNGRSDAPGTPGKPGYEPPVVRGELDEKGKAIYDAHRNKATKEWLMESKGFNQEDADRMMADGAYSYKDMMKEKGAHKDPKAKKDVAAEPKGKGSEGKPKQEDFEPAYEGGDYSQEDINKMTEKEKAAKIDGYEAKPKKKKTPLEQEGPIPKKNIKLQKGENPDTYLFGHNYGDEDIEGAGEGFEPTGTRDEQFTANERINDLEERAGFLIDNDIPDLEGSTDPKDVKKLKTLKSTAKRLQNEADIMRKRRENERKASSNKMKSPAKQHSKSQAEKQRGKEVKWDDIRQEYIPINMPKKKFPQPPKIKKRKKFL